MKNFDIKRKLVLAFSSIIFFSLIIAVWIFCEDTTFKIVMSVLLSLLLAMTFTLDYIHSDYTNKLLIELSKLLDSIINMQAKAIFSEDEDTILSKLQMQVVKLSGILKAQTDSVTKEKDEIKTLISDISHQIKTPVATIKMFGELLQDDNLSAQQRAEYLFELSRSLDKLTFLTDSMIKMSRLESGIIKLAPQTTELTDIILKAIKQIYHNANDKNIEIAFDCDQPFKLILDERWTEEAIFNILDNAVKYTPHGGKITISIQRYDFFTRLDIKDTGIGINETELPKIFGRFYRSQGVYEIEGVGIGLYLSRKIITDQGGYIKVSSNKNGSTFSIFMKNTM